MRVSQINVSGIGSFVYTYDGDGNLIEKDENGEIMFL